MGNFRLHTFKVPYVLVALALLATVVAPILLLSDRAAADTLPAYRYSKSFNTSGPGYTSNRGVATDGMGNVYVTGFYSGTVTFGNSDTFTNNNGNAFLSKFSNNGTYQWTRTLNISASGAYSMALGVATDIQNNAYITGTFGGNVTFGGGDTFNGGSHTNAYVAKFEANGDYVWAKAFNVSAGGVTRAEGNSVAVSKLGDVYVSGRFNGNVTFGGSDTINSGNNGSGYLTKYDSAGTYEWTKSLNVSASGTYANAKGVAADEAGNAYFTGSFGGGTVVFGGTDSLSSTNNISYLAKYSRDGAYGWARKYTSAGGTAYGNSVATSNDGSVYTAGDFNGSVTFGASDTLAGGSGSGYISRYDADGTYVWTSKYVGTGGTATTGYGVTADSAGNAYLTGDFVTTSGFFDTFRTAYLTQYAVDGTNNWAKSFDVSAANANASSRAVASDKLGNMYIFGDYSGGVVTHVGNTLSGAHNGFLVSYRTFVSAADEETESPGDSQTSSGDGNPIAIPNAGDANADGVQDSTQPHLAGVKNVVTGSYTLVQAGDGCTLGGLTTTSEASLSAADSGYSYPSGLADFTVTGCGAPGYSTTITQYYYDVDSTSFVVRKFNSNTKQYATIDDAVIGKATIGGQSVIKATYQVTDGGPLDEDGTVNGTIVDPAGLAFAATPSTGLGTPAKADAVGVVLAVLAVVTLTAGLVSSRRQSSIL